MVPLPSPLSGLAGDDGWWVPLLPLHPMTLRLLPDRGVGHAGEEAVQHLHFGGIGIDLLHTGGIEPDIDADRLERRLLARPAEAEEPFPRHESLGARGIGALAERLGEDLLGLLARGDRAAGEADPAVVPAVGRRQAEMRQAGRPLPDHRLALAIDRRAALLHLRVGEERADAGG